MYQHLFYAEEPGDDWEAQINPESEIVKAALVDESIKTRKLDTNFRTQFERIGFFVVDKDSKDDSLIFNLTVSLKDSKPKSDDDKPTAGVSRKEEQARQLAEKLARMKIAPQDLFKSQTDLYSKFDDDGIPTHDIAGEPLSKSNVKKLKKEYDKHKKLYESNSKS